MTETRVETDTMGPIEVPADRLWGAQTQRSLHYFAIGHATFTRPFLRALGLVKKAAALANAELGELSPELRDLIVTAADEVIAGHLDDHFPLRVFQTGSGTQTNMNANEVIANRANQLAGRPLGAKSPVHPNDHVNLGQSSNDVFPTAMHVAAAEASVRLLAAVSRLRTALDAKAQRYADLVKIGRTHLQDATPLTLGQEISGWVAQLDSAMTRLERTGPELHRLALGGTAVGTGLNAHPRLGQRAAELLAELTGLPLVTAPNKFEALASHDALAACSAALRTLAGALMKIANDIRWLASGPRSGLGELGLPENEPGSSIMPGKVNPTQAEALTMVACQVYGHDAAIAFAASQGNFELNVYKPVIIHNLLDAFALLTAGCDSFREHCVLGLTANEGRIAELVEGSLMLVTALTPHIGYDRAAAIAKHAHARGLTLRAAALEHGIAPDDFARWVDAHAMTGR